MIPQAAVVMQPASVDFRVSPEFVRRFAALTGDWSRLHVDEAFARRSAFRRPVVHGMLPVSFLPLLPPFQLEGFRCALFALSSRFTSPIFADVPLTISAKPGRLAADGSRLDVDYEIHIAHEVRRSVVTSGTATLVVRAPRGCPAKRAFDRLRGPARASDAADRREVHALGGDRNGRSRQPRLHRH